jgi:hypothetical protein
MQWRRGDGWSIVKQYLLPERVSDCDKSKLRELSRGFVPSFQIEEPVMEKFHLFLEISISPKTLKTQVFDES